MTGGACHSIACRHSAWSPFHVMKFAYDHGVPGEGCRQKAVRALDYVRDDI